MPEMWWLGHHTRLGKPPPRLTLRLKMTVPRQSFHTVTTNELSAIRFQR